MPFYDNKADLELKNLIPYLRSFLNESDVRVRNNEVMKLAEYTKYRGPEDLINKLYKWILIYYDISIACFTISWLILE